MRTKNLLFPLAALTAALVSCAGVPARPLPAPLTVELFDWRAAGAAAGGAPEVALASPVTDSASSVPDARPAQEISIRMAARVEATVVPAADLALRLPAAPAAPAAKPLAAAATPALRDASLVPASRLRVAARFALSLPEAPPAAKATAGRTATAPAPAPAKTPAARVAPAANTASTATSATGTPVAAASSTAAASTAAAAASAPAAGDTAASPTADSYGRLREIYARQDDEMQIGLDGAGFLFLGLPDAQADGMSFKGKETKNGKTYFTFQALKLGSYDLDFLKQDNTTGKSAKETVRVHVVTDQDFASAVAQAEAPAQSAGGEAGDPSFAARLTGLGAYNDAIAELLKGYREGNPGLNDQIAALYMRTGALEAAARYYSKNLSPANAYTRSAVLGMVKIAVAQRDQQGLMTYLKQFLSVTDPAAEETFIQAARMEKEKQEVGVGLDLAAEYALRYPGGKWRDEAEFMAAELLMADSSFRDIPRARVLYSDLLARFPESDFADTAQQRLLYIDRHFYQVR